ncbi:MAG: hypothetical protein NHB32_01310 [Fischerella sp. CENA71]|nr:hypothetical protein [Fischerella sp. CENA71]
MSTPLLLWKSQFLHATDESILITDAFHAAQDVMQKAGLQNVKLSEFDVCGNTSESTAAISCMQIGHRFLATIMVAGNDAGTVIQNLSDRLNKIKWL